MFDANPNQVKNQAMDSKAKTMLDEFVFRWGEEKQNSGVGHS